MDRVFVSLNKKNVFIVIFQCMYMSFFQGLITLLTRTQLMNWCTGEILENSRYADGNFDKNNK